MYIYIYICVRICISVYTYVYIYIYLYVYIDTYIDIYVDRMLANSYPMTHTPNWGLQKCMVQWTASTFRLVWAGQKFMESDATTALKEGTNEAGLRCFRGLGADWFSGVVSGSLTVHERTPVHKSQAWMKVPVGRHRNQPARDPFCHL